MIPESYHHFRQLLIQQGAISLPGIGTFVRSYRPAIIHDEDRKILPPGEQLNFKGEVKREVLFSEHLTEQQFIDPETAQQMEADLGSYLRRKLQADGKANLPALGTIQKTGELITFVAKSNEKVLVSDHYYGLKALHISQKPKRSGLPELMLAPMNNGTQTHEKLNGRTPINWQPYTLVGLLVLIGVLVIYNGPFMNQQGHLAQGVTVNVEQSTPFDAEYPLENPQTSSKAPLASAKEAPQSKPSVTNSSEGISRGETEGNRPPAVSGNPGSAEVARVPNDQNVRSVTEETVINDLAAPQENVSNLSDLNTAPQENPVTALPEIRDDVPVYHLIAASFTRLEAAEAYVEQAKKDGYRVQIIFPDDGPSKIHRVSIYQSHKLGEVKSFQTKLMASGQELLWIYEK